MDDPPAHCELLLPAPVKDPPAIPPMMWSSPASFWLEIHRDLPGRVRYALGSHSPRELESMLHYLENSRPRMGGGSPVPCAFLGIDRRGTFARAVAVQRHHHLPLEVRPATDQAGFLLRTFGSRTLERHDVALQLLFRRRQYWESSLFSTPFATYSERQSRDLRAAMEVRRSSPAYHVELRAHVSGPYPRDALAALGAWLEQWTTVGGVPWRRWQSVREMDAQPFHAACTNHDLQLFSNKKPRRDVSASELTQLLSFPWAAHHPECSYAGAPAGRPRPSSIVPQIPFVDPLRTPAGAGRAITSIAQVAQCVAAPPMRGGFSVVRPDSRFVVGMNGTDMVALPPNCNHLAILGRTQSGKSTLVLHLVLQILERLPGATVIVVEPTGTLVDGLVSRLTPAVASETVEIDPGHATFSEGDQTNVAVPLGLLRPPDQVDADPAAALRWSEALAGDLLAAIRSAWGEESIGGRAELILRALVQGLSLTTGSNLVDAYHILSSKAAVQRFVRTAPPGPLRDFLERHLPRLDYNFTMSSLDKVGKVATNPLLRIALCQRARPVSLDRLLRHSLLLLNLSKAELGADGANFLGAIYLTQLWGALQRTGRADRPVYLFLDEVHNYAVPALADMLSEGAKFGLHVVAVTQFFHRVPPRVRAAVLGNVDAWLLFALGVDDMEEAFKIVNGATHGWVPQDLVEGLHPHEVAMSVAGDLVKLATRAAPPASPCASQLREAVTSSSRRYAQPEDSEASPWLVGQEEVEGLLRTIARRPQGIPELAQESFLPPDRLAGALARAAASGDVEREPVDATLRLTPRGDVHLRALEVRRNEGEEHVETLTEFAMFLQARGIALNVPEQAAGLLTPDGQFQWGATTYNVEVECSTLAKAGPQVIRNLKKGKAAGYRVLIVLPDRGGVPRALNLVEQAAPGFQLWKDGVGLVWKEGRASFRPHLVPGTRVWPFLDGGGGCYPSDPASRTPALPIALAETDPLPGRLRSAIANLLTAGKPLATAQELVGAMPRSERTGYSEEQVGRALRALGIQGRRAKSQGVRFRVYDLTGAHPSGEKDGDLALRSGTHSEQTGPSLPEFDRVSESPIENRSRDPVNSGDPED